MIIAPHSKAKEGANEPSPIDWGEIYVRLLEIGLRYDEIPKRTFPQIQALLNGWDKNFAAKLQIPNIFGTMLGIPGMLNTNSSPLSPTNQESTQEEVEAFFNSF